MSKTAAAARSRPQGRRRRSLTARPAYAIILLTTGVSDALCWLLEVGPAAVERVLLVFSIADFRLSGNQILSVFWGGAQAELRRIVIQIY
jgi:hypothetical protein